VKTTSRQTFYLPSSGLVEASELKPGELIAVNKESYNIYEKLPPEYDSRVKAMEVDERPTRSILRLVVLINRLRSLSRL
jgi:26S proteasome regulatory subunit T5